MLAKREEFVVCIATVGFARIQPLLYNYGLKEIYRAIDKG